jgi:hypothetical protein
VSSILMAKNDAADSAAAAWRWSSSDEGNVVAEMSGYSGSNLYQAFQVPGTYTYKNQSLPVKVGAQVVMKYLKGRS